MLRVSRAVASVVALEARTKIRRVCFQIRCLVVDCVVGDNSEHGIEALRHDSVRVGLQLSLGMYSQWRSCLDWSDLRCTNFASVMVLVKWPFDGRVTFVHTWNRVYLLVNVYCIRT